MDILSSNTPQKQCTVCKNTYPATLEYFNSRKRTKRDGLTARCKTCINEETRRYYATCAEQEKKRVSEYYKNNPDKQEQRREYHKAYNSRPEVREMQRLRRREYRRVHRQERQARPRKSLEEKKQARREYLKKYYSNPEKKQAIQAYNEKYRQSHLAQQDRRIYQKEYYKVHGYAYQHSTEARELKTARDKARYARKRGGSGTHSREESIEQYQRQKGKCYYCHQKIEWGKHHEDHVVPLSRGGSNEISNIVIACPTCNLKKNDKLPHEWDRGGRLL